MEEQLYAIADYVPEESKEYLSPNVPYKIVGREEAPEGESGSFTITNDTGTSSFCLEGRCAHIRGRWRIVKESDLTMEERRMAGLPVEDALREWGGIVDATRPVAEKTFCENAAIADLRSRIEALEKQLAEQEKEFVRYVGPDSAPPHVSWGKWYEVSERSGKERLDVMFHNERGLECYPSGVGWEVATFRGPYFVKEREDEPEWPQGGDNYHFIGSAGEVDSSTWVGDVVDRHRQNFMGIFRTRKGAECRAHSVREFVKGLNEGETP